MFKFDGFCDDKQVVTVMKLLTGKVMELHMVPVVNAQAKNGKVVAKTSGDPIDMLIAYIKQHKLHDISGKQIKAFSDEIGRSVNYHYIIIKKAKELKLLKRKPGCTNANAIYFVNKEMLK